MSWREQLQEASFRGVAFSVQEHDAQGGRRVASHEYPQRDKPYTEDLGRKQRSFSIQGVVIGENYFTARDDLVAALEQPGSGLLVHPWLGRMQVVITGYSVAESTSQGGLAKFSIQCAESGLEPGPAATDGISLCCALRHATTSRCRGLSQQNGHPCSPTGPRSTAPR